LIGAIAALLGCNSRSWENANRISGGVAGSSNGTLRLSENITSYSAGEDAANSRYAAATDSTGIYTLNPFPCLLQSQAHLLETLDSNRGENPFAPSKMSVQDGLAV
jgi:hypothetical protein